MAIKTRDDYLAALRQMRPNIYKFGELIEDVTTHPATKRTVESHARCYDAANDPDQEKMYTTTSIFSGEKIQRWNSMMQDEGALISNMKFKRQNYRRTGTCTGAVCVGWNAMNVMWAITEEMDAEYGTDYKMRLKNWILHAEKEGLTVAGALTDAKGDRSKSPSQQADPDTNLHVKGGSRRRHRYSRGQVDDLRHGRCPGDISFARQWLQGSGQGLCPGLRGTEGHPGVDHRGGPASQ